MVKSPSWKISEEAPDALSRKGTGLLDVYYGPMRIVREDTAVAEEIAQHFSQPEAASFRPKLLVQYPVYTQKTFPEEEKTSHLILINTDTVCGTTIDFPIKTEEGGYEYQGKRFSGDYCVLQAVPNPFHSQRSILKIFSNNLEKFANHLLLRKVILPSMLTGISPYWNAEGLILTNDGITAIREWQRKQIDKLPYYKKSVPAEGKNPASLGEITLRGEGQGRSHFQISNVPQRFI